MDRQELPLGLGFALAQDPEAMEAFTALPEADRAALLERAHTVSSREEMQALVNGLTGR